MKPDFKMRLNWVGAVCLFLVAAFQPAQAALLGITLSHTSTVPYFLGSNVSNATFDTVTDNLVIRSETSKFTLTPINNTVNFWYVFAENFDINNPATFTPGKIAVRVKVSNAGVVTGTAGNDLEIRGTIIDRNGVVQFQGLLLAGEVLAMGSQGGAGTGRFDFRFSVTGGALASYYTGPGKQIGVVSALEGTTFTGGFAQNFTASRAKTDVGGVPTLCVSLEKQVSLNGIDWFNADTVGAPDVPVATVPSDARYRMIATNCGTGALVDVTVTDPTLGLSYLIGNLAAGASVTVAEGDAAVLFVADRCENAGTLINSAQVSAKNPLRTETRVASDDAVLVCVTTPQIAIKKQISVDGGVTWFDADNAAGAPVVTAPHGAEYRFIVTNTGTADLTGVVINDATLGIVNYPVGDLAVGASAVVGSGEIPAAAVAERCANPGEFTNTASTSGQSADDGSTVNDSDVAVLVCAGQPGIEIIKQISVDGGATWADANAPGDADTPTVPFPHGAEYRFIVRNIGQADLVNVSVSDPELGVTYDIPGVLVVGAEVVVASGDVAGALTIATRCDSTGTLTNVVSVTGDSADTGEAVTDSDPAVINCVGTPDIQLRKQISLDGIGWADADTVGAADTPVAEAPSDAYYRFLVSNVGNVDLVNVVLSDPTIGISYTIGSLAVGQSLVVDSGVIPDGLLVVGRCTSAGDFVNIADVSGDAADTGTPVSDTDPAVLTCTPPDDGGSQGCTPGYWRQAHHYGNWVDYAPNDLFSSVFEDAFPGQTLGEVVQLRGGDLNALGRHTVAALLNASSAVDYGMTPADVIAAFNAAYPDGDYEGLKDQFAFMNERGCPLGRADDEPKRGDNYFKKDGKDGHGKYGDGKDGKDGKGDKDGLGKYGDGKGGKYGHAKYDGGKDGKDGHGKGGKY